ncbi:MAG: sulfatase-like hydrolase/transferase [Verrucomicrobiota bacterium]
MDLVLTRPMMRFFIIAFLFALATSPGVAADRPNIIYILMDDLGYGDLGCFGQETLTTPHIDQLAADGMKLTRHYSGSTVCAPSRCVLLTGKHTGNASVRGNGLALLKEDEPTLASALKSVGYQTGAFGKWGLGSPPPRTDPNDRGFDEFYGYVNMHHAHNFYPEFLIRNGQVETLNNELDDRWRDNPLVALGAVKEGTGVAKVKNDYAPTLFAAAAVEFLESTRDSEAPFFLYFAPNMPHTNNEAGRAPYNDGMEVPDYGEFENKDWPNPEKGFAQMIRLIDNYVGEIVAKVEDLGQTDHTLIMLSSDNGPHQEGQHLVDFFDSNGPLRGQKRDLYEGGVRVPTIATWPGRIPAGSTSDHLSGFVDVFPTFAEIAGFELPENLDGKSFAPTLFGNEAEQQKHEFLYWEFLEQGGKKGVVTSKWKAIQLDSLKDPQPTELYDLENDPSETTDIAEQFPEVVQQMEEWIAASHRPPSLVKEGATFTQLGEGFKFTEGPAVSPDGKIFFNDIPNERTHIFDPATGAITVYRENTGRANGLFFTADGALLACEGGNRRITRTDPDGSVTVIADQYDGKKLNSPNDLVPDSFGGIYFTDPRYGNEDDLEQDVMGVYYLSAEGEIVRVIDSLTKPNGIILSPHDRILYVADPGSEAIWAYPVRGPGRIGPGRLFAEVGSDGMTMDGNGNLYVTWTDIIAFSPDGREILRMTPPEKPANCLLVGQMLYVTARTGFYSIEMEAFGDLDVTLQKQR